MNQLLLYCRPGFEGECAAEIQAQATAAEVVGYAKTQPNSGYVLYIPYNAEDTQRLVRRPFIDRVFARQCLISSHLLSDLDPSDRLTPILAALATFPAQFSAVWLETPDTNEAKELSVLCRKFAVPVQQALKKAGRLREDQPQLPRLHLLFTSSTSVFLALSWPNNSAAWPMGIPRLKFPSQAPSRSTLKLEEAFLHFLTEKEREQRLRPGLQAVDLGAAPGGWTWQLVRRHIYVMAIDNGPMDNALLDSGLVKHKREDGFRYRPPKPVDWLVCDMVEQPVRIAELCARWLAQGWAREAIFNLKLPMKKRYQELERCRDLIEQVLEGRAYQLRMKQLYHDREEVTAHLVLLA